MFAQIHRWLRQASPWRLVLCSIIGAVAITNSITSVITLMAWQKIVPELLFLGTLNSAVVPLLMVPWLIRFIRRTASLVDRNAELMLENAERRRLEQQATQHAEDMSAVNQLAIQCAAATLGTDLYALIAETICSITKTFAVIISAYDTHTHKLTVRHAAVSNHILQTASQIAGRNIIGMEIPVSAEWIEHMQKQSVFASDDLYDLGLGAIPKPVVALMQQTFGIGGATGLAFNYGDDLFGSAMVVMHRNQSPIPIDLAKMFANVAAVSLRRQQLEKEREKLVAELEAKNKELERFTYTVSHDLKAPLITIRGFLGFLDKDVDTMDCHRVKQDVERIRTATDQMQRLLNELLELSRVGRVMNAPQNIPFHSIVQDAIGLVSGRLESRGVQVDIDENLPTVYGDRVRLVQVAQNLIDNAVKFMGDQKNPRIEVGTRGCEDGKVILFVRDNGIGIDAQHQLRVFDLFTKLDKGTDGTGIGLALVERIVHVHGGKIWVESEGIGKGSTFCFTLALAEHF